MDLLHRYRSYEISHAICPGVNFPYYALAKGDIRIDPFINNRLEAYDEFQDEYDMVRFPHKILFDDWHGWLKSTVLEFPDSMEKSAEIGPSGVDTYLLSKKITVTVCGRSATGNTGVKHHLQLIDVTVT